MVSCLRTKAAMEAGNSFMLIMYSVNFMISFILSEDASSNIDTSDPAKVVLKLKYCIS